MTSRLSASRFKDDHGNDFPDWEEKKLGEVYAYVATNSLSRDKLNYESGEVFNIHYGDIHTKFRCHFYLSKESVPYLNDSAKQLKIKNDCYVKHGDIVLADASEDYADIGKSIEILDTEDKKIVAGLHTYILRPDLSKIAIGFGAYLMQAWPTRLEVMTIAQGTKVLGLPKAYLSYIILKIPAPDEQKKIADFLTSVDTRIGQLTEKKALLEDYKKGVMQQLFTQAIRFKDDHGNDFPNWDLVLIEQLYPQIRNGFVGTATPFYCDNGVQYVQGRNIKNGKIQENGFVAVTQAFHKKNAKSQLQTNDVLMVQSGHVGECAVVTNEFNDANCHALLVLTPKDNDVDSRFYVSYFYSSLGRKQIYKIKTGNTIAHILSSDLKREIVPYPSLPEQTKIADFLSAIDRKIESVSNQITETQTFKRGLLQQMFV